MHGPPPPRHHGLTWLVAAVVAMTVAAPPAHGTWLWRAGTGRATAPAQAVDRPSGAGCCAGGAAPIRGPVPRPPAVAPVGGAVVRPFDPPATPYGRGHRGVDLMATPGEVVRAALPGAVTFAGVVAGRSWVTVAHRGGLRTTYGGLRPAVAAGERVSLGDPLGRATGGTVEWGARRDGAYVDPMALLGVGRVRLVPVDGSGG